jgi:hypothetical protein
VDSDRFLIDEFVLLRALLLPGRTDEQVLTFLMSSPWHGPIVTDIVVRRFEAMLEHGVLTVSDDEPWPPLLRRPNQEHVARWRESFASLFADVVDTSETTIEGRVAPSHAELAMLDAVAEQLEAVAIVTQLAASATGTSTRLVTPAGFFDLLDE